MRTLKHHIEISNPDIRHIWIARDKDLVVNLLEILGEEYTLLSKAGTTLAANGFELLAATLKCAHLTGKHNIDLWFTKYGAGNIAARLMRKKSISFNDDDIDIVPLIAATSYPFADQLIFPRVIRSGRFKKKATTYNGCQELVYLHPDRFKPDRRVLAEYGIGADTPYCLIRLSALAAHHDIGAKGLSEKTLIRIVELCEARQRRIIISSEKKLPAHLERYKATLAIDKIHHLLACADFYAGDSQSMALEAAVLGTPSLRVSTFTTLSIINHIQQYGLIKSFPPDDEELIATVDDLLSNTQTRKTWRDRRQKFLDDKQDPLPVFLNATLSLLER